jgi:hypothetical protein
LDIKPDGGVMPSCHARWLAVQCFYIPPYGGAMPAKGLKAESEQVMEHHLRREELEGELFE